MFLSGLSAQKIPILTESGIVSISFGSTYSCCPIVLGVHSNGKLKTLEKDLAVVRLLQEGITLGRSRAILTISLILSNPLFSCPRKDGFEWHTI